MRCARIWRQERRQNWDSWVAPLKCGFCWRYNLLLVPPHMCSYHGSFIFILGVSEVANIFKYVTFRLPEVSPVVLLNCYHTQRRKIVQRKKHHQSCPRKRGGPSYLFFLSRSGWAGQSVLSDSLSKASILLAWGLPCYSQLRTSKDSGRGSCFSFTETQRRISRYLLTSFCLQYF